MSILDHFKHLDLSPGQESALEKLQAFLGGTAEVFMLKGYAGSGKTTILKGLVEYLNAQGLDFMLMAPTGRAAKVIRERTGQEAFTIHKSIYSFDELKELEEGDSFQYYYSIRNNADIAGKVFIVDESSMISDAKHEGEFFRFGSGCLLSDLITYTRVQHENANSKIIFVGDPCQLPPVGDNSSKAFNADYLEVKFGLSSMEVEMKEVMRQSGESGILKAAAKIRKNITAGFYNNFDLRPNEHDIFNPFYDQFLTTWQAAPAPKIIIAGKNKTCLDLNLQIRQMKYGDSSLPVQIGDIMIVGANNYRKGILNGEFAVVSNVSDTTTSRTIHLKGKDPLTFRWRDIELIFPDAENQNKTVSGKMLENFLYGDNFLKPEETQGLYVDFTKRYENIEPKTEEFKEAISRDEFFNCLLLKYGYAVTGHKAQGGEWDHVFTVWDQENQEDFNCYTDKQLNRATRNESFFRWAYTAITRASKCLYALNPPYFNSYSNMAFMEVAVMESLESLTGGQTLMEVIEMDDDLIRDLREFNLLEQPVQLQDHFIKVRHAVRKHFIDISGWEKKNMEVFYYLTRENQHAGIKTWCNKDLIFNGKYQKVPSYTSHEEFYTLVESLLRNLPNITIKRNTPETIISKIEFDIELEEQFPFIFNLYEDLSRLFDNKEITIDDLEHYQYKERYTFRRGQEKATIDFGYNKGGFFGRVDPIPNQTNSNSLLSDIWKSLQTLKQQENAG